MLTTPAFHLSLLSSCHHLLRVSVLTLPPPLPPFPPALLSSLEAAVKHYYYFLAYTLPFLAPSSPHGVMQQTSKKKKPKVKVSQSCLTLCDSVDCIVHGILQARILEWVAFLFSRGSFHPSQGSTQVSCIAGGFFTR